MHLRIFLSCHRAISIVLLDFTITTIAFKLKIPNFERSSSTDATEQVEIFAIGEICEKQCKKPCQMVTVQLPVQHQQLSLLQIGHLRKAMTKDNQQPGRLHLWQCLDSHHRSAPPLPPIGSPYTSPGAGTWLLNGVICLAFVFIFAVTFQALFRYIERREAGRAQGETISLISTRWK